MHAYRLNIAGKRTHVDVLGPTLGTAELTGSGANICCKSGLAESLRFL